MTTDNKLYKFYTDKTTVLTADIQLLKRRNRLFVAAELTTFLAGIALVVAYTVWGGGLLLVLAAVLIAAYVAIRRYDVRNGERIDKLESVRTVYSNELKYLDDEFSQFDDGVRFINPKHSFTFDMDIFGPLSLYHRINRTVTSGGSDYLAACLSNNAFGSAPGDVDKIDKRREAINKLAKMEQLRTDFIALGSHGNIDTPSIIAALGKVRQMSIPSFAASTAAIVLAWIAIACFVATILLSLFTPLSGNVPVMWGTIQLFVVLILCAKPLRLIGTAVNSLHGQLKAYVELIRLMSATSLKDISDPQLSAMFGSDDDNALQSFGELKHILEGLDRRSNVLGLVIFDTFMLSDFFLVRRFLKWQRRYLGRIEHWIDNVSTMDALVSMATFRYNEPEAGTAEVVKADRVIYEGMGLYHPFLGANAVRNDFEIKDGNYYIVTGANMAGKSTFLRSIGVNYVLAVNGMPVFADKLRVSVFNLFSSMRTSDDLGHGISYFNAELLRLQQLIDSCKRADRTLIILDEILKGTNSLDKLNGSRMFLDAISRLNVSGLIATHDLELSKMADEHADRFHNWCFEIKLSDDITYTYRITPGVARNQNATYLLRNIIASID